MKQVRVPWGEERSRFTVMYEALILDWLRHASIAGVAEMMGLSWDEVDGVMSRGVERGLRRRRVEAPERLGVDETSFQKRHEYVTVVNDLEGRVLHVSEGHGKEALREFYEQFEGEELGGVKTVAMDMWEPYIQVTEAYVPQGAEKIAFDKFHVASHLGEAIDRVRRQEQRKLPGEDYPYDVARRPLSHTNS